MARIDLYGERKATLYRSFKEGILSEQEYIAEANACATKADELRIFAHELEKEAQKYSPEYKGSIYWTELIKEYGNRTELDAAMVDALIDEVVLFNDGHYEVKLKYRDEMEELLLNAALWQKGGTALCLKRRLPCIFAFLSKTEIFAHQRIRARATVLPISGRSFKAISSRLMICSLIALRNSVMTVIAGPALSDRISSA